MKNNESLNESFKEKIEEINEDLKKYVNDYLMLAREIFGSDVDETFSALNVDSVEVSKSLFFSSLEKLKKIADGSKKQEILDVVKRLEFEEFKESLLGLRKVVNKISISLNKSIQLDILGDSLYLDIKTQA